MRIPAYILAFGTLMGCAGAVDEPCLDCVLADANNFSYVSDLQADTVTVRAQSDVVISWDTLSRDLQGHPLDPLADINQARLIAFRSLSPAQVLEGLQHDALDQADIGAYVTCAPTDATCSLSDFGMYGNQVDIQEYFVEGYGTWLLALGRDGEAGADALSFLRADSAEGAEDVHVTDASTRLQVEVDFTSLAPVVVEPGVSDLTMDWSALTLDGLGDSLEAGSIDTLFLARFAETPVELEGAVFDLEDRAQKSWTLPVSGRSSASLAELSGDDPFLGIDRGGTWLLALQCGVCTNPAPRFVTFLAAE